MAVMVPRKDIEQKASLQIAFLRQPSGDKIYG